jgi:hypothetical protein
MKLGTHMPVGERRKPIDNEVCRTKVKVTTNTTLSEQFQNSIGQSYKQRQN